MKSKILTAFAFLLCAFSLTAFASVELNDNYYYDPISGTSCFFGAADTDAGDECGIILTDKNGNIKEYPSKIKTKDGRFGILLKDPGGVLKDTYDVSAYVKKTGNLDYSEKKISFSQGIISANAENVTVIVSGLKPGDVLLLESGIYENVNINITASGTEDKPITVRSRISGGAEFKGTSVISVSGSFVNVSGLFFNSCVNENCTVFNFNNCSHSRLTDCYFLSCGSRDTGSMISVGTKAVNCRIDNNLIEDSRAMSIQVSCGTLSTEDDAAMNTRIDHNWFYDIHKTTDYYPGSVNGFECIQTGTDLGYVEKLGTIVEYNRFEKVIGESSEIISNKSNGNIFRYNTFINCPSSPTIRKGNDCVFEGNYLINVSKGLRVYGAGHQILNNYFYQCGNIVSASGNNGKDGYLRQENVLFKGNIIIRPTDTVFTEGKQFNTMNLYYKLPRNVSVESNYLYLDNHNAVTKLVSENGIVFSGNTAVLKGAASLGDVNSGFTIKNEELVEKDGIKLPESLNSDKRGLIKVSSKNNWWMKHKQGTDAVTELFEPDETPVSFEIYKSEDHRLCVGDTFNFKYLSGVATYENGKSYTVPTDEITYTFSTTAYFNRDGDILTMKNSSSEARSFFIFAEYKGLTASKKVYVYPKAKTNADNGDLFYEDSGFNIFNIGGTGAKWSSSDGILKTTGLQDSIITLVGYSYQSGNFDFQCDITVTPAEGYTPNVSFVYGYRNFGAKLYNKLTLTDGGGVFPNNSDSRTGELIETIKPGVKQRLRVVKNGNRITASLDGKIVSLAEVTNEIKGKFGFHADYTNITVENIDIFVNNYPESQIVNIPMEYERLDSEIVKISFDAPYKDCVYKVYKNGEYTGIMASDEYYVDIEAFVGEEQIYTIEAYDICGVKKGEGTLSLIFDKPAANEFFMISDVYSRNGTNGEYVKYYTFENRFLEVGSFPYCDRSYKYTSVADEFLDCGYIRTGNGDRLDSLFRMEPDDWLKFKINRSATVYVIFHKEFKTVPAWLSDWDSMTDTYFDINNSIDTSVIYYKHFNTKDGEKLEIKLGGCRSLSSMYQIVIKPDNMAERVNVKRKF